MKKILGLGLLLVMSACGHHRDVRPGSEGTHRVQLRAAEKDEGEREAIAQANHFCEKKAGGKSAAFVNEQTKYEGSMKEENYKALKTGAKVAQVVGGAGYVFGGSNEKTAGGLVGLGGVAADAAAGEGYLIQMSFKCQ